MEKYKLTNYVMMVITSQAMDVQIIVLYKMGISVNNYALSY